jgi:hypothetical protein
MRLVIPWSPFRGLLLSRAHGIRQNFFASSFYSCSRSLFPLRPVPKVLKGSWKLPEISDDGSLISEKTSSQEQKEESELIEFGFLKGSGPDVPRDWRKRDFPDWKRQTFGLKEKFHGSSWRPNKKISREAMEGIRFLKKEYPELRSNELANRFKIPYEAVRRILKSNWKPSPQEEERIQKKWLERGKRLRALLKKEEEPMSRPKKAFMSEGRATKSKKNINDKKDIGNILF